MSANAVRSIVELDLETDERLVAASRAGDRRAFGQLVERHADRVSRTIAGMLGRVEEVDDVAQEVFIKFYDSLPSYRGDASVSTYLGRIAVNRSLDVLRRRKRRRMRLVDDELTRAADASERIDGERTIEERETRRVVHAAIQRLSPEHRAVVVLRMIEGYSTEETAQMLDVPYGTVLSRLNRAMDRLRRYLEPAGERTS